MKVGSFAATASGPAPASAYSPAVIMPFSASARSTRSPVIGFSVSGFSPTSACTVAFSSSLLLS